MRKFVRYEVILKMQRGNIMNNDQIQNHLLEKILKEHAFWSYDQQLIKNVPDEVLIEKVLLHLDIEDVQFLFKVFHKNIIKSLEGKGSVAGTYVSWLEQTLCILVF